MQAQTAVQATSQFTLGNAAAIIGMILGTAGFVMSWMNYLRDRPRITIRLQWDMQDTRTGELFGLVRVTNVGRRPVFLSIVAVKTPESKETFLVLHKSIGGKKLDEGSAPQGFPINYAGLTMYSSDWRKLRAYAEDSTGRKYLSKILPRKASAPSWVRIT